jgi:hypothetical protein
MTSGSQLRKELEARVKNGLAERGYRRQRVKERYRRTESMESPLEAQLLVSVNTDRYGLVRIAGAAEVVCDAVADAYDTAPEDALSLGQQIYRDRGMFPLGSSSFKQLSDAPKNVPLEWTAADPEKGAQAVDEFFRFVDGPVRTWLDGRSTVAGIRVAADEDDHAGRLPEIVRNMSVFDVLHGDPAAAHGRLRRYAEAPSEKSDSLEQVEAFRQWLTTLQPSPDLRTE